MLTSTMRIAAILKRSVAHASRAGSFSFSTPYIQYSFTKDNKHGHEHEKDHEHERGHKH